jgi:hypothetical protein
MGKLPPEGGTPNFLPSAGILPPAICFAHRRDNVLSFQRLNNLTILNYAIA